MLSRLPFALTVMFVLFAIQSVRGADDVDLGGVTERHEMVSMRDGVRLSVYIYTPAGKGPWPVLLEQRYADIRAKSSRQRYARLASHGFVVAAQNFRGTHQSEGTFVGYRDLGWGEKRDGYDTVEWLATQSWSTGKIGTFGGSQAGYAQNFLAITQPPHLVCQFMTDTGLSLFHEGYRIGGTTRPGRFTKMAAVCRDPADASRWLETTFEHPTYDDYWAQEDCTRFIEKMNVPCFTVGSWYDFMCVGSVQSFVGRQHRGGPNSRNQQQLLIGPWLHGGSKTGFQQIGDLAYADTAWFDLDAHMVRWFDHHLKGVTNGVERDAAVRYFVMGAVGEQDAPGNVWRTAGDWPVAAKEMSYYLRGERKLALEQPSAAESATTYRSDPAHPAPLPTIAFPGARDAREFESHADVRTFTSDLLTDPVEWTGLAKAELFVSSTARDADFIVRVSDVYPDGRSILLIDSVRRSRYRDGFDREVFMEPGKVYPIRFDIGWLSQIFNRGHRIRVTIASTGAEFYEPNPQTGDALTIEPPKKVFVAENTIHHRPQQASRIIAPVIASSP